MLTDDSRFDRVIQACEGLVENEVANKRGLSGGAVKAGFKVVAGPAERSPRRRGLFGLYLGDGRWFRLESHGDPPEATDPVARLDVAVNTRAPVAAAAPAAASIECPESIVTSRAASSPCPIHSASFSMISVCGVIG